MPEGSATAHLHQIQSEVANWKPSSTGNGNHPGRTHFADEAAETEFRRRMRQMGLEPAE